MPDAQTLLIVSEETSIGMPHHHVLHLLGGHVGALERGADGDPAQVGGVQRGEAAAHLADGRPGAAEDDGAWHAGLQFRGEEGSY